MKNLGLMFQDEILKDVADRSPKYVCSINGAELEVGQENLYDDPCQDWLDLINKKLTSPNYPEDYDPNTICKWNLTTEKGNYISLDFEHISVSDKDIISNV